MAGVDATGAAHPLEAKPGADHKRTARIAVIVLDASVVVELLTNSAAAAGIRHALAAQADSFIVPHLVDVEVLSALRRLAKAERIPQHRVIAMLDQLAALPVELYGHTALLGRIWELRHNFTAYDATYIALAEALDATLYTRDDKLAQGHRAGAIVFQS